MATTYMGLTLPTVSTTPGPDWSQLLNDAITSIDSHDHTTGKGQQITPSAMNINTNISFGDNDITDLGAATLKDLVALHATNLTLFAKDGELYYNDGAGNNVLITSGGTVNISGSGGIGGDYSSTPAVVNYTDASLTYFFKDSASAAAKIDVGDIAAQTIIATKVSSGNGTAGVPGFNFSGDPDNGMFLKATNALGFSTAGIERFSIDAAGLVDFTAVVTFAVAPVFSSVTASQILSVDGSKGLTSIATTGTGSVVLAASPTLSGTVVNSGTISGGIITGATINSTTLNSPTLVTPALGTPSSGVATNITGLPLTTGVTGTLPVANGGTGVTTKTGTGSVVLSSSPTLVTPALGTPSALVLTNATGTPTSIGLANGTGLPIVAGTTGTLTVARGGTGTTTSTGTGSTVLSASPTLTGNVGITLAGGGNALSIGDGTGDNNLYGSFTRGDAGADLLLGVIRSAGSGFWGSGGLGGAATIGTTKAQEFQIATNNAVRMTILSDGKVGILNTAPSNELDVTGTIGATTVILSGDGSASAPSFAFGTTTDMGMYRVGATTLGFSVSGTERMRVDTAAFQMVNSVRILNSDGSAANPAYAFGSLTDMGMFRTSADLAFSVGGAEKMRITSTGDLGIGDTPNTFRLRVVQHSGSAVSEFRTEDTSGTQTMIIFKDGAGVSQGAIQSDTTANTTSYGTSSDARLKTNIQNFNALDMIAKMNPVVYERHSDMGKQEYGFIAQELHTIVPQAVSVGGDDVETNPWMVDYSKVTSILTKGVQELREENKELKLRIEALESK